MGRKKRANQPVGKTNDEHVDDMDDMGDMENMNLDDVVTDSEEEYTEVEKKLLEKMRKQQTTEDFDSDDEVYKLQDSDKEEDEEEEEEDDEQDLMESDIEGLEEDDDNEASNDKAWGNKAKAFYSSDYKYTDYATAPEKDLINAEMEEEEGRRLHLRSIERYVAPESLNLSQIAQLGERIEKEREDDIKDSVQTSEEEEKSFMFMVNMFKNFMTEVRDVYAPFFKLVDDGTIPECEAVDFVRTRYRIVLNYCTNISFCLMLKVKGIRVRGHPVVNRLAQYNELLSKIDECKQEDLLKQMADIVRAVKEGKPLYSLSDGSEVQYTKKKKKKEKSTLNSLSKKLARQKKMKKQEKYDESDRTEETDDKDDIETMNVEENVEMEDNEEEGKRAITYEMAKNKGLTPYRKKEQRNPRVKYRNKYHKALVRRRGAVKQVRKELTRYQGEISGIKAGAIRSIKLT